MTFSCRRSSRWLAIGALGFAAACASSPGVGEDEGGDAPSAGILGYVLIESEGDTLRVPGADVWTESGGFQAVTDSLGAYALWDVNPGAMDVKASWHQDGVLREGAVTVEVRIGATSQANILLGEDLRGEINSTVIERLGEVIRRGPPVIRVSGGQ